MSRALVGREDGTMKRASLVLIGLLLVVSAVVFVGGEGECREWQGRYKRVLFLEIMKNSPVIMTPELVEEQIGARPGGCQTPALTQHDIDRYRR
jgi:hypothetical protein